jgi:hypothetical protein
MMDTFKNHIQRSLVNNQDETPSGVSVILL